MHRIIPAIIPTDATHLQSCVPTLRFAPTVQIDIVDGCFATPASWPYEPTGDVADAQPLCEQYDVQVDIMAVDPEAAATAWHQAGAREFIFHVESLASPEQAVQFKHAHHTTVYLAANDTTPLEQLLPYVEAVDGVQLMGIHTIGQQGQPLSDRVLENIATVRAAHATVPIIIDGSVNETTIQSLKEAGATDFVVGSAITHATDPRAAYHALCQLVT